MTRHILVVKKDGQTFYIAYPPGEVELLCKALLAFAHDERYHLTSSDVEAIIRELFNRVDLGEVEEVLL